MYSVKKKKHPWIASRGFLPSPVCLGERYCPVSLFFCVWMCTEKKSCIHRFLYLPPVLYYSGTLCLVELHWLWQCICIYTPFTSTKRPTIKSTSTAVKQFLDGKGSSQCHKSTKLWCSVQGDHSSGRHAPCNFGESTRNRHVHKEHLGAYFQCSVWETYNLH